MKTKNGKSASSATTVYRMLQSPAPICMFYFAHPFGISSPATTSTPSKSAAPIPPKPTEPNHRKSAPQPAPNCKQQPPKTEIVRQRPENREDSKKTSVVTIRNEKPAPKSIKPENRVKLKKAKNSSNLSVAAGATQTTLSVKPHSKAKRRPNVAELDTRQTTLIPWPSTIWNRDFLIPPLLQVLAKQHGRKIPDIEQILRTVRSAWNTPKSQRSIRQSQDSKESSASTWDLSSSCDSYYCDQERRHSRKMGAGTYATVVGTGPGLLRRRYSVPEIIMRKHTLAQQKSYDEPHDTNHNNINVNNKNYYPSQYHNHQVPQQQRVSREGGKMSRTSTPSSPISYHKQQQQQQHHHHPQQQQPQSPLPVQRKSITRAASSVESGTGDFNTTTLASTGSESNLATMKRQQSLGGISRNQKCSSVNGLNSSTNNNNYPIGSTGVNGVGAGVLGGMGGADFSMRKSTLLRRMWSKEMRRYDRSGSWSPPLRRAPRRIYSIESILPPEGLASGGSGSSEGSCATVTTTSCKECAKLESQYNTNARAGKLASESPKRLRLAGSLTNLNNNLQKVDSVEGSSRTNTPDRNPASSDGFDSASVITKSSKPEISSTTGTTNTPLIRHKGEVVNDRSKRTFVFMNAGPDTPDTVNDVELDEADLSSSTSSIVSQTYSRPIGLTGNTGTILEASEESTPIDIEQEQDDDEDGTSTILNEQDNESDLSEFLKEETNARENDIENCREVVVELGDNNDADVHTGKCGQTADGNEPSGATGLKVSSEKQPYQGESEQFPLKKDISRRGSNASSSAVSISAESTESESVYNGAINQHQVTDTREATLSPNNILKNDECLDEYISNLLVDNLNNLLDSNELVKASVDGSVANADQKNNNRLIQEAKSADQIRSGSAEVSEMKQKLTGKYINGGGGVVCNSPPDAVSKLKHQQNKLKKECEKENTIEDTLNNNRQNGGEMPSKHVMRKKANRSEKQPNSNGFYLVPKNGSRDSDGLPSEIDLNGKYYFPAYGVETDPSDHTDIASEPEVQIIGKIGTGSTYRGAAFTNGIVPRISAMPRTESMEVQPSTTSAEEEFDDLPANNESDSDTPSLVDSLDEVEITPRKRHERRKSLIPPSPIRASTTTDNKSTTKSETNSSPRHEKGEAFFVPIQDSPVKIDEHIVVADTMPLRIKERLNNRQRLMVWKKEQDNLKKHRKMMRMIEQKKFYGEPAIQVISTIDRAISRKEHISPAEKKRVFGQPSSAFTPKVPKAKKKGNTMRTELGMLESYKIDARGNMQIQNPAAETTPSGKKASKSPWGQAAERRQAMGSTEVQATSSSSKSSFQAVTATTTASSKTPKKTPIDPRRKQILKDVQQMTLYPQADLTPDIERGPRRMYQKTEIQEGDKHIEILEIVECAESAPGDIPRRPPRVRSATSRAGHKKSQIPVPVYRWGRSRRSNYSRESSPLSAAGTNPKVDRMIADLLIEALTNPDDVGVKFIKSPDQLREKSKRSAGSRKQITSNSSTPRRSANSGKYTQRFEVIPEERSSVSVESSSEEFSSSKKKHISARRVSFDDNHKILNVDELQQMKPSKLAPKSSAASPKPSPKKPTPNASPSPKAPAMKKNTTTSRGKAAIQSEVVEEKGWIGFTTQHEDIATPVNGEEDGERHLALAQTSATEHERRNIVKTIITGNIARESLVDTSTQQHIVDHFHRHQSVNISVNHDVTPVMLTSGSVTSVDHMRSTVATVGSNISCNGTTGVTISGTENGHTSGHASSSDMMSMLGRSIGSGVINRLAIATTSNNRRLTSGEFSDESCFTDSLNTKPTPKIETKISRELSIPIRIEQEVTPSKHGERSFNELKSTAESMKKREVNLENTCDCSESVYPYRQIREENAWHIYEMADCKVFQSKIEYFETSIHRTPLAENHQNFFGPLGDKTAESLRCAILKPNFDNFEIVRHELKPDERSNLTSSDTLDSLHVPAITMIRTPAMSEDVPKTSETCSSCCFCNPELHKYNNNQSETCFYCQAKSQTPSKYFPAPPTPPNIQMSPLPPSPKTPITELTPTPTLQEIPLPSQIKSPQPQQPQPQTDSPPTASNGESKPTENPTKDNQTATSTGTTTNASATSINGLYTETTKKTDHTHTKTKTKTPDTVSTKCTKTNEKTKRSYVPATDDIQKLEEISKKHTRKKSETTVLNRPKNVNNLNRATSVIHTVQKEVKNELKTPIKVLPKTAKELSNRKERDKQITLNLPLEEEHTQKTTEKPKAIRSFETMLHDEELLGEGSSQSYDESSSSSSTDTSPNSSPFKKCAALPPAARWKHNSERNLTQLTMQKISAASKWGNKWRKAARQHERGPEDPVETTVSPIRRRPDEMLAGEAQQRSKLQDERLNGGVSAATGTTATAIVPSIATGVTQSTATNQGWTVTVAGNYNPEMAPDVEMRLSFPKQSGASSSTSNVLTNSSAGGATSFGGSNKRANHPVTNGHEVGYHSSALVGSRKQYIEDSHHIPGRGGAQNYALLDDDSYGGSRGTARAALPPAAGLNPKRTLSRADGNAGGKDYRLPNVGTSNNVTARQNAKKSIKQTMECSVVASATTRTVANKYHLLSHQHQLMHEQAQQQANPYLLNSSSPYHHPQHSSTVAGPPTTATATTGGGNRGGKPRATSIHALHPSLQNGGGGKFLSSNTHQPRYHDSSSLDYGLPSRAFLQASKPIEFIT
ncbi:uncharacterized protein LOC129778078 isoform X4 [Toxorhynchites rutilus septentrionalis]|uniref:uncharacterized protein LOC129778078 isoform X4 n=1 Tax=Toxorhynchites rutilus septentrionalis TaxID=329112 RepID=UPI00247846BA|nr:uncharacterized protein LOC129778078 isoform X4 [Toxorhynchites rutilus septentrionalis]